MSDEIQVGGVSFVPSKRAAEVSGYKQDYVGQLCRAGLIDAKRINGLWYVNLDSLYGYKQKADSYIPQPPRQSGSSNRKDPETIVSFDGKEHISASRAAEITGYSQDYVGQLARTEKVLSRQVGSRWYVERAAVLTHKAEKDALLAEVQAQAVGIDPLRSEASASHQTGLKAKETNPYFTYSSDDADLLPLSSKVNVKKSLNASLESSIFSSREAEIQSSEHKIPIRVLGSDGFPEVREKVYPEARSAPVTLSYGLQNHHILWIPAVVATVVIVFTIGYASLRNSALYAQISGESSLAVATQASQAISFVGDVLESWLAPEIIYRRQY